MPAAENCTSSGAAPVDGSANASTVGACGSTAPIENATDLIGVSWLPALSVERYSMTWLPGAETVNEVSNGSAPAVFSDRTQLPVAPPVFTRYSVKSTPEPGVPPPPAVTSAVPTMPSQAPLERLEWTLQTQVHVPTSSSVSETGGSPGDLKPDVICRPSAFGASPGSITQTSCTVP